VMDDYQKRPRIPPPRAFRDRVWPGTAFARAFWEMSAASRWQLAAAAYGLHAGALKVVSRPAIATLLLP
jgi:hypothetical protein